MYYGRHFRSPDGEIPALICGILMPWGTVSTLTLPADNGTWGVGFITSAKDAALRGLKDTETWMRTWRSFPLVAHWADGEPLDDEVAIMAKIEDRHRTFVVDGTPVATGVLAVGDSWACTNPSLGRGASIACIHAVALRDLLQIASIDFPMELAQRWHEVTEATVEPYYRATLDFDRHRLAEIDAGIDAKTYDPGDPSYEMAQALASAAGKDPDLFRAMLNIVTVLKCPDEVFAPAGVTEKVLALGGGWRDEPVFAPTREELLAIVAG
jgi:flavin-dependent dehydrogenase